MYVEHTAKVIGQTEANSTGKQYWFLDNQVWIGRKCPTEAFHHALVETDPLKLKNADFVRFKLKRKSNLAQEAKKVKQENKKRRRERGDMTKRKKRQYANESPSPPWELKKAFKEKS